MARSSSNQQQQPAPPAAATVDAWHEYWRRRPTWTLREFAFLCCGWDPSDDHFGPDDCRRQAYNEAVDTITRAVRAKILPASELAWPATGAEAMYDSVPAFQPRVVAPWAVQQYSRFPYRDDPWARETIGKNLTKLRAECGWTVEKLAEKVKLDPSNVKGHLAGRVRPTFASLSVYAACFVQELNRPISVSGLMKDWPEQVCPASSPPSATP